MNGPTNQFDLVGIYLNYLKDGTHYVPSHSHKGMVQLVISLGADRTLTVGAKDYRLKNGDVIIFGASAHAVPPETNLKDGRISIATFMVPKGSGLDQIIEIDADVFTELLKALQLSK